MTRLAVNGIHLNVEVEGDGPALLLLHGFTGSVATWAPFHDVFAGFRTVPVDLIGHGDSDAPADPARYTMAHACNDLVAVLDELDIARTALLGYSLGGRVALHLALHAPERLAALVLESASPGIADPAERAARRASDAALADRIERDGIEAFVDYWQVLPLWASQARLPAETRASLREQRLQNRGVGLANSLRGMGAGVPDHLGDRLRTLDLPTLALAGALDVKYAALAADLQTTLPRCQAVVVPDAGHAIHFEQPAAFADALLAFLNQPAPTKEVVR